MVSGYLPSGGAADLADTEISAPAPNAAMASSLIAPGTLGSGALGAYGPGICFMLLASALFAM